jgi:hypothetical protein
MFQTSKGGSLVNEDDSKVEALAESEIDQEKIVRQKR